MSIKKNRVVDDFERSSQNYYQEISAFTPLTKKEEQRLWARYKKNHDLAARNKIIESNLKFVASIAKSYRGRGLSYPELIAEGNFGLLKALDKFEGKRGNKLTSYSVWWIRQSILDAINRRNIANQEDFPADYEEPLNNEETNTKEVVMPDAFIDEERSDDAKPIARLLLGTLDNREYEVIARYYGLDGYDNETLEEIGASMGLTKERVRQISQKALVKMRGASINCETITIYN
jgi:RNA polymerase sigma factor (sigma-70 family)